MSAGRPVRAVVYGVGAMGSIMAGLMLDKGCEIVGAVARSPEKIGRDLGDVAGLGRETGVIVDDDPERVLGGRTCRRRRRLGGQLPERHVRPLQRVPPPRHQRRDDRGRGRLSVGNRARARNRARPHREDGGATLAASGAQDVFWMHLVGCLLGAAHRIDSVEGRCSWNADDYGPEVAGHVHLGETPGGVRPVPGRARLAGLRRRGRRSRPSLPTLGFTTCLGSLERHPGRRRRRHLVAQPRTDDPGRTRARRHRCRDDRDRRGPDLLVRDGRPRVRGGESDANEWHVRGDPPLELRNDRVPTRVITCTSVVNRIPDVIAAPPGLITLDRLPRPRYRPGPYVIVRGAPRVPQAGTGWRRACAISRSVHRSELAEIVAVGAIGPEVGKTAPSRT